MSMEGIGVVKAEEEPTSMTDETVAASSLTLVDDANENGNGEAASGADSSSEASAPPKRSWKRKDPPARTAAPRARKPSALVLEARAVQEALEAERLETQPDTPHQNPRKKYKKRAAVTNAEGDGPAASPEDGEEGAAEDPGSEFPVSRIGKNAAPRRSLALAIPHVLIIYHEIDKQSSAYFMVPSASLNADDLALLSSLHGSGVNRHALGQLALERLLRKNSCKACLGSPLELGKQFVMEDLRLLNDDRDSALVTRQRRQRSGKGFHNMWVDKAVTQLFDISFIEDDRPINLPHLSMPPIPTVVKAPTPVKSPNPTAATTAAASSAAAPTPVSNTVSAPTPAVAAMVMPGATMAGIPQPPMAARAVAVANAIHPSQVSASAAASVAAAHAHAAHAHALAMRQRGMMAVGPTSRVVTQATVMASLVPPHVAGAAAPLLSHAVPVTTHGGGNSPAHAAFLAQYGGHSRLADDTNPLTPPQPIPHMAVVPAMPHSQPQPQQQPQTALTQSLQYDPLSGAAVVAAAAEADQVMPAVADPAVAPATTLYVL